MPDPSDNGNRLALLAHDLRTPLAAMRLTAELISKEPLSSTQTNRLEILIRAIDNLTGMTSDLVKAASASGTRPSSEPVLVQELLHDTTDLFRMAANARGLVLTTEYDDTVEGCATRFPGHLARTVATLLDNAIKYTSDGMVHLSATCRAPDTGEIDDAMLHVTVSDTGPGLKDADIASVFKPFVRGTAGYAAGDGAGLGLWGASELLREIGGSLNVTSPEQGGCQFEVSVPVMAGAAAIEAAIGMLPEKPAFEGPLSGHFLIVDDNGTNRRLLAALLESFGASLQEAGNGREALEAVSKQKFDAILLDLHMPGMSGLDVAKSLKEKSPVNGPAVIAVTAAHESADRDALRETGIETVIAKPISPADLYGTLSEALSRASRTGT